uniref:Uncharacterized protein n=1 Tax=Eutreptiella gymnastica TaxID=73025 RepID=A0A7S4GJ82_9EUGL
MCTVQQVVAGVGAGWTGVCCPACMRPKTHGPARPAPQTPHSSGSSSDDTGSDASMSRRRWVSLYSSIPPHAAAAAATTAQFIHRVPTPGNRGTVRNTIPQTLLWVVRSPTVRPSGAG